MTEFKQVIVMRKDLGMRKGKMIAQGAHASMAAVVKDKKVLKHEFISEWLNGPFTKICVSVNSEAEVVDLYMEAKEAGMPCSLIKDAGKTEFDGIPTITCCGIGPGPAEKVDKITGELPLL